jgi:hypothetical protein
LRACTTQRRRGRPHLPNAQHRRAKAGNS